MELQNGYKELISHSVKGRKMEKQRIYKTISDILDTILNKINVFFHMILDTVIIICILLIGTILFELLCTSIKIDKNTYADTTSSLCIQSCIDKHYDDGTFWNQSCLCIKH